MDNDPLVLAHAHSLLTSSPEGATTYRDADLRDTGKIRRPDRVVGRRRQEVNRAAALTDFTGASGT